jgi:iron complex transport system ATP-binding protein
MLSLTSVSISRGSKALLNEVNLQLSPGDAVLITGPNGIGKSSLLAAIAGDLILNSGEIRLGTKLVQEYKSTELASRISIMYQKPVFSVSFFVAEVLDLLNLAADSPLFESLGLVEKLTTRLSQLSGGELQRLFFYITLQQSVDVYIFDEPISNQDETGTAIIESEINKLRAAGKIVVLTSHTGFVDIPKLELSQYKNNL